MNEIQDRRGNFAALPERLEERCRPLNEKAIETCGGFVLYWMHHAVGGHENPALDGKADPPLAWFRDRRRLLLHRTHAGPAQAVHSSLRISTTQSARVRAARASALDGRRSDAARIRRRVWFRAARFEADRDRGAVRLMQDRPQHSARSPYRWRPGTRQLGQCQRRRFRNGAHSAGRRRAINVKRHIGDRRHQAHRNWPNRGERDATRP